MSVVTTSSCPSVEKLNTSDTEALYPASSDTEGGASCFPDRPITKNIFKPKNSGQRQTNSNRPKAKNVPYKPVERKVPWNVVTNFPGGFMHLKWQYMITKSMCNMLLKQLNNMHRDVCKKHKCVNTVFHGQYICEETIKCT